MTDPRFPAFVIDRTLSLSKLLRQSGFRVQENSNIWCPFHDDLGGAKRSAKLYTDTVPHHIFCFSEHRIFRASHVITLLLNRSLNDYFETLWPKISELKQQQLIEEFGRPQDTGLDEWKLFLATISPKWKAGFVTQQEFFQKINDYNS